MGHERSGVLPKTDQWRRVVSDLGLAAYSDEILSRVADRTLTNVRRRFDQIQEDPGVRAAFGFLVGLATAHFPTASDAESRPQIDLGASPSALKLIRESNDWIDTHAGSPEYGELAKRAAADAIQRWTKSESRQASLFSTGIDTRDVWRAAGTGRGFCEVARAFFGGFVERYLKYFLEREASAELPTLNAREEFGRRLEKQIDDLSHHAFDTAQITQSFAAGWLNKRLAENRRPSNEEIAGFLAVAFGKLRQELRRETGP